MSDRRRTAPARFGAGLALAAACVILPVTAPTGPALAAPTNGGEICQAPNTSITDDTVNISSGQAAEFVIQCFPKSTSGQVSVIGPSGERGSVPFTTDLDGNASASYIPTVSGQYTYQVTVGETQDNGQFSALGGEEEPTDPPTEEPTDPPTEEPTDDPTGEPTDEPTDEPTEDPTDPPTEDPTDPPTEEPTGDPTDDPTGDTDPAPDPEDPDPSTQEPDPSETPTTPEGDDDATGTTSPDTEEPTTETPGSDSTPNENGSGSNGSGSGEGGSGEGGSGNGSGTGQGGTGTGDQGGDATGGSGGSPAGDTDDDPDQGDGSAPSASEPTPGTSSPEPGAEDEDDSSDGSSDDATEDSSPYTRDEQRSAALALMMTSMFAHGVSGGEMGSLPSQAEASGDPIAIADAGAGDRATSDGGTGEGESTSDGGGDELAETGTDLRGAVAAAILAISGGLGALWYGRRRAG